MFSGNSCFDVALQFVSTGIQRFRQNITTLLSPRNKKEIVKSLFLFSAQTSRMLRSYQRTSLVVLADSSAITMMHLMDHVNWRGMQSLFPVNLMIRLSKAVSRYLLRSILFTNDLIVSRNRMPCWSRCCVIVIEDCSEVNKMRCFLLLIISAMIILYVQSADCLLLF